jgi:creatinine amidohydrolase/Fe(II)-dependent formamide hydrolase-like protein
MSPEHAWASGTLTLPIGVLTDLLDAICGEYVRATAARNLVIVNGHGGNRGLLEAVIYQLRNHHGVNVCVLHPSSLATVRAKSELPEVHAGLRETSVMLALVPEEVRIERLPDGYVSDLSQDEAVRQLVLDRGVTWPWDSNAPSMSQLGIIGGNPRHATAELGEQIIGSALDRCPEIFARLTKPDS